MKEKFNGSKFLYDRIEYFYENEGDHIRTFIDDWKDSRLDQLFELYNRLIGEAPVADDDERHDREKDRSMEMEVTRIFIANELELTTTDQLQYLVDCIEEFRQIAVRELLELKRNFINHHHDKTKAYTGKPVW